ADLGGVAHVAAAAAVHGIVLELLLRVAPVVAVVLPHRVAEALHALSEGAALVPVDVAAVAAAAAAVHALLIAVAGVAAGAAVPRRVLEGGADVVARAHRVRAGALAALA